MKPFSRLLATAAASALLAAAAVGLPAAAQAADSLPASPTRWVTDGSGFLSSGARQQLDDQLQAYEQRTGHQILVWITDSAGNRTPEDFASKTFAAWKVGRANIDDGVVLFVFAKDRKLRFEVGYGLEEKVPDAVAGRILREQIVPRLQTDDRDGAVTQGIAALIAAIDGTAAPPPAASAAAADTAADTAAANDGGTDAGAPQDNAHHLSTGEKIVIALLVIGFLILLITNPSLALWLLFNLLSSGGGGGSSGRGGGFSGGGGRSGGGGASGSW